VSADSTPNPNELVQLGKPGVAREGEAARRPSWMRVRVQSTGTYDEVKSLLSGLSLHTVCEEARCPNIWECWGKHQTATFMILGKYCTRSCRYCSVPKGKPKGPPDADEPAHVAEAVVRLGITHAVVTSVDRDDLPDYGSMHFVRTIEAIRARKPGTRLEVLIPDFLGDETALRNVLMARPEVLNHNTETVPRLYRRLRPKGSFSRVLELFGRAHAWRKEHRAAITTKSGIMCGLGETKDELLLVMDALREAHCDVLTFGQYLNPTKRHAPIDRFYTPDEFAWLKEQGLSRGFLHVESGPLVRSSYHAHEHVPAERR
jgi:lipoic acid synthetase